MKSGESPPDDEQQMPTARDALIGAAIGAAIVYGGTRISSGWLRWTVIVFGVVWVTVMMAYVTVVFVERLRPRLGPPIKKLRGHVRTDPRLGAMTRDAKAGCWTAVPAATPGVEFQVDGEEEPDERLVNEARDVTIRFDALKAQVADFVAEQARIEATTDAERAAEIAALRISRIVFLRDRSPGSFLIEFEGPDEETFWQCEYADGRPDALDFD